MVADFGGTSSKVENGFIIFFLYLFVTFYVGNIDVSSYIYCTETFPNSIRAQGVGISVSDLFIITLIYTQAVPTAFDQMGWRYFLVFIIVSWIRIFLMAKFFPETVGFSLEEIARLFGDKTPDDSYDEKTSGFVAPDVSETSLTRNKAEYSEHYKNVHPS